MEGQAGGVLDSVRRRWAALPVWARWFLAMYVVGFADGTGAHVRDLAERGIQAYSSFGPAPIQVILVSLVVLDPAIIVLVALALPIGVRLAAIVMVLDLTANWIGNWPSPFRSPSLLVIPLFAAFVLTTAPFLLRAMAAAARAR